jgi:DNA processing protein
MASVNLEDPSYLTRAELAGRTGRTLETERFAGVYVAGDVAALAAPSVGVVGTRAPSPGGRARAHALAAELAAVGVTIVSGLAYGVDGAAHEGALAAGGATVGVLGGGHRCFFPARHRELALRMLARGAVLSPYAPDHPAFPAQFLQRNGIVAALCDAIVVVEAAERSGALNTAGWAADRGIPVFAFPGDVDRPKAAGCNALIRDGATLVRGAADVLEGIGIAREAARVEPPKGATDLERAVLAVLADGEATTERVIERTLAGPGTVVAALIQLEIAGTIERRGRGYAIRAATNSSGENPRAAADYRKI